MSWSRRAFLAALAAAPLGACGFHPLYGGRLAGEYDPDLAAIKVQPIPDRQGQIVALDLREKLNPRGINTAVRYLLRVRLDVSRSDLGIQRNATSTRGEINASAQYQLISGANLGDVIFTGRSKTISSFNELDDAYATKVAEDDARTRALHDLADDIFLNLQLYVKRRREAAR